MSDKAPLPSGRYYIRNDGAFAGSIESFVSALPSDDAMTYSTIL
jgi:hypothetical protein